MAGAPQLERLAPLPPPSRLGASAVPPGASPQSVFLHVTFALRAGTSALALVGSLVTWDPIVLFAKHWSLVLWLVSLQSFQLMFAKLIRMLVQRHLERGTELCSSIPSLPASLFQSRPLGRLVPASYRLPGGRFRCLCSMVSCLYGPGALRGLNLLLSHGCVLST